MAVHDTDILYLEFLLDYKDTADIIWNGRHAPTFLCQIHNYSL